MVSLSNIYVNLQEGESITVKKAEFKAKQKNNEDWNLKPSAIWDLKVWYIFRPTKCGIFMGNAGRSVNIFGWVSDPGGTSWRCRVVSWTSMFRSSCNS